LATVCARLKVSAFQSRTAHSQIVGNHFMKNSIYLFAILLLINCSTRRSNKKFDGFWRLNTICTNGEIIENKTIIRIENDTLFTLSPDNIDRQFCYLDPRSDSITISENCRILRNKVKFHADLKKFGFGDRIQFEQLDSNEIKTQYFFDQVGLKIDLPTIPASIDYSFSNPKIIFIGYRIPRINQQCPDDSGHLYSQSLSYPDSNNREVNNATLMKMGVVMKYNDMIIYPEELDVLKSELLGSISLSESISLILCIDQNVSDSTVQELIKVFEDQRVNIYQMGISNENPLDFKYKKTVANN
jgi:hypothetical protein